MEITINYTKPIQLQSWTLSHAASHFFTFPRFDFQPERVCRVYANEMQLEHGSCVPVSGMLHSCHCEAVLFR